MKKKLLSVVLILSLLPASLMALGMYYSKAVKEEMSDWIGTGTVEEIELIRNEEVEFIPDKLSLSRSIWKMTFLIHKVIKEDDSREAESKRIEMYYSVVPEITCPPQLSIKTGDKAKVYLVKDAEFGIPNEYWISDCDFFMKVDDLDNLPDTLPGEEERVIHDKNPIFDPGFLMVCFFVSCIIFF